MCVGTAGSYCFFKLLLGNSFEDTHDKLFLGFDILLHLLRRDQIVDLIVRFNKAALALGVGQSVNDFLGGNVSWVHYLVAYFMHNVMLH